MIEDDDTVRSFVHRALEAQGYRIITATDGEEGLRIFRQHQEQIDLLLSDMVMPKMGGAELAEIIQQESPGMKVLFMSGYTERTVLQQGNLTNGINFIPKPVTVQSLTRAVRSAVAGKIT